ncbi:MAG: transglycosylase domain-containing protein [Erysipelotrichaceae bacterium]|nr:transglycosylase domain-containing protein [Erysipelotrichaceae bacterium]
MSAKKKKKKRPAAVKPQEIKPVEEKEIIKESAEDSQNLLVVSEPEASPAAVSSAPSENSEKPQKPKKKRSSEQTSERKNASSASRKTASGNKKKKTQSESEKKTSKKSVKETAPEAVFEIPEETAEIPAETGNQAEFMIPEDADRETAGETVFEIPEDTAVEAEAATASEVLSDEKENLETTGQPAAKKKKKSSKKKKNQKPKPTTSENGDQEKTVFNLDDESSSDHKDDGKSDQQAAYYDISDENEIPKEKETAESAEKPTVFSVDEQETAGGPEKKEEYTVHYDLSEAEELEDIKNELQQMAEQSDKKEEKIEHYENNFLLDEEPEVSGKKSRLAAFFTALLTGLLAPFRKFGSILAKLFKKEIPQNESLSFNEDGLIIPVQVVDSDGNIIDLKKPETLGKLPLFRRLSIHIRDYFRNLKKKIEEKKAAKKPQEGEVIYKGPITRIREFIASIREKRAQKKQQQQAEAEQQPEEFEEELEPSERRALKLRRLANAFMGVIVFFILLGALSGFSTIAVILNKTDVVLDIADIHNQDSTRIFDDQGEQIAIIGQESRISVSYSTFPQVVVDAFVAIEDSRFFEHPGFDVPRFAKAFLENIKTLSFAQGGSTLTMQVIKNTYFAVDTIAEKGIDRKVQEIYYSLKINNIVSKEKIFELYVNKVNFGETARGIQVASQYYFGKDCNNLTLVEAALLAGLVQAPNTNNPYFHLEECTKRTGEVLYQMKNHGYITDEEYRYACSVRIENLLVGTQEYKYGQGETVDNQAYIDIVLAELDELYDINPYDTPVLVYTCMNQTVQSYCDEVSRGNIVAFPDEHINTSLVCIRNNTGELVGLCGGRDYDGKKMFNYAYDNRVNPGSTSKGIFTYPMAFEHVPLATNHYIFDEPIYWTWTRIRIGEDHGYAGDVSTQRAFTTSYNVVAVKLFQWVEQTVGMDVMKDYLKSIGVDAKVIEGMNEQYAIGMQNFRVSPIQLAGAESVILSHGQYIQPHTIRRIEFINSDRMPIECSLEGSQVLSEGAAWLTRYLQEVSVNGNGNADDWIVNGRLNFIKHSDYTVYGKTGTGLYDKNIIKKYNWPDNATKDYLMIGGTNDYTFALWIGYDTGRFMDKTTHVPNSLKGNRTDGKIVNGLLNSLVEAFGKPVVNNPRPDEVTTIRHIKGLYPYLKSGAISAPSATSYILKKHVNDSTYTSKYSFKVPTKLDKLKNFSASYNADSKQLTIAWTSYPNAEATRSGRTVRIVFDGKTYTLTRKFDTSLITGVVQYCAAVTNNATGETQIVTSSKNKTSITINNTSGSTVTYTITGYYGYSKRDLKSNQISVTVNVPSQAVEPPEPVTP